MTRSTSPEAIANLFIGAGAMKCGTTWLYRVLATHPAIHFSPEKELHYFFATRFDTAKISSGHRAKIAQRAMRRLYGAPADPAEVRRISDWYTKYISEPVDDAWYLRLFGKLGTGVYGADFSNLYSRLDAEGWRHVRNLAGNLKVIYIMRHPLDRLWSHLKFQSRVARKRVDLSSLDAEGLRTLANSDAIALNGDYTRCIERMRECLQPQELLVSFYEEIHQDPRAWLSRLARFLCIEDDGYDVEAIGRRYNTSVGLSKPTNFDEVFAPLYVRECDGLKRLGLDPQRWWTPPPQENVGPLVRPSSG